MIPLILFGTYSSSHSIGLLLAMAPESLKLAAHVHRVGRHLPPRNQLPASSAKTMLAHRGTVKPQVDANPSGGIFQRPLSSCPACQLTVDGASDVFDFLIYQRWLRLALAATSVTGFLLYQAVCRSVTSSWYNESCRYSISRLKVLRKLIEAPMGQKRRQRLDRAAV